MKTHTGKISNYSNGIEGLILSSNLGGDFNGGYTTMKMRNLTPQVEGKDLVFDVMLKVLVGYKQALLEGKLVTVHIEWDITDDYREYIACRVLSVEVKERNKDE